MVKKLNEGRVRDVITLRDLFSLTRANIRVTIVDTSIDEFVVEDDYIYNVVKDSPTVLDFPVDHFSPRSSTSLWIEVSVGIGNIGGKLSAYKESKLRTRKRSIKEGAYRPQYYDPELEQFEIFLMTNGREGQDEIREYVDSRRDTGIFGSIGSEYGNISVWVNTESIDDEFMDEVEALIDFAQDRGARLNVKCFNELKDLFTVKHAPYDI